jgi:hypothetical protein
LGVKLFDKTQTDMKNSKKTSEEIDEERVVQTHSNLSLTDARPGESTFATGTKNHSTKLDHAYDETPEALITRETPEDKIALTDDIEAGIEKDEDLDEAEDK